MRYGKVYGVGLGPGNPELISLKAHELISNARYIGYFSKKNNHSRALNIAKNFLKKNTNLIKMEFPVTTEIPFKDSKYKSLLASFYEQCCNKIISILKKENDFIMLCEGDPFFYGSFIHLYFRLRNKVEVKIIPGITGMSSAWTSSAFPITWRDETLTVIMGTKDEEQINNSIKYSDAIIFMKIGKNFQKINKVLKKNDLYKKAVLVEYASMENERVRKLSEVNEEILPYFSIIIVHGIDGNI